MPFPRRAWHAGRSSLAGRAECNDFSIGIELEGSDDIPYAGAQYQRLEAVLAVLMAAYPAIRPERVVGHCHVAPARKSDPGPVFEWGRLARSLGIPAPGIPGVQRYGGR
ncbi:1,6-anhydro-N-acetylmuramyl-L-alanine amidase AmpD [wastewater metagenome]|uniref:1,6-anhydro-N-acetylmuramyl-L-alanine amidase AmpD n=2 Tax=unclassified sequences TaxID=12908 RepID=A0A5B8REG2_9ZZZZ|nr:1,6-anhydro-N-acetylmuramyl-L-alanine amidase AmpD [uncultured organism]